MKPILTLLTALLLTPPAAFAPKKPDGRRSRAMRTVVALLVLCSSISNVFADEFFTLKIEPLLKQRCFECHSHEKKMRGGLTLDSKSGWEQGGDSGPAVIPGKPEESLLIQMVRWADGQQMPPKEKLPAAEIALLEEWVKRGAPDPRVTPTKRPSEADWWSQAARCAEGA